ncbi:diacylglycerol kinase (ATP) [Abditibacterium utsteinense]|uniref:Diacylglycerol kinase (ATP) n=1 Tax=Abditibacterium utsteinense TaxID=1960156 RepID=A0A2S8SWC4_9BACT|nr:diacylglycerol kinase family protein [Abditibacterium utsteinense]PQV65106.1 diacylglycerol kinase (ATP) [Abditibacterium utsteinense]
MKSSIVAIINPKAGSSDDDFRAQIEAALQKGGAEFEIKETDPEDGAISVVREAVENGATQIIACGGDGTIMSAVNGLARLENEAPKTIFSIIPGGTANLLAQALGIPDEVEEAAQVALTGRDRLIDLGQCGEDYFALGLGIGLTEKLVSGTSSKEKEKLGRLAYAKAMLAEMGQKPNRFSFKLDEKAEQSSFGVALIVANAGEISDSWKFAPDAEMDDGLLDLCILHRLGMRDLLRLFLRGLFGKIEEDRVLSFFQAKKIEITTEPPLDMQIDGEVVDDKPPLTVEVRPKALKVRVPQEEVNR